jgi:ABC-type Na+ efflux pump permease subunit
MNVRAILAIVRKDIKVVVRNKGVMIPMIILPVLFFVIFPGLVGLFAPAMENLSEDPLGDMQMMLDNMPVHLESQIAGLDVTQTIVVLAVVYMLAPMFLIVPMMVASVIAADSFAGEKERKTLEALLYTPATDRELYVAKLLAAWLPALVVTLIGFIIYSVVANAAAWQIMGGLFFPNTMWILLVIWVAPGAAGLGLSAMVLASSRAQGFQDAYQIGTVVVLPIVLLLLGQVTGVMYFSVGMVALLGVVFWAIDAILLWIGVRTFQRGELIARL